MTIIFFFVMMLGMGFSLCYLLKLKFDDEFEKIIMYIGLGLGTFVVVASMIHILHIPIDWKIFLGISVIVPVIAFVKNGFKFGIKEIKITKSTIYTIGAICLSLLLLLVYLKGAFGYPYMENDDSWMHAYGAKYIAVEKTAWDNDIMDFKYSDPYPPSYDILMAILHQTNNSMQWTLKFFNSLIVALGIVFFYFFAVRFMKSRKKALAATFVLTMLPCFMSHFIWAQTLALVLFFPAFYCFERDGKWWIAGAMMVASVLLGQPSTAVFLVIMGSIYWIGNIVVGSFGKQKRVILMLIGGGIIAGIFWSTMFMTYGLSGTLEGMGFSTGLFDPEDAGNADTSGGIVYSLKDYMIAPLASKMDQPTGIGVMVFLLVLFTVWMLFMNYKKMLKNGYLLVSIVWLVVIFLGTEGNALPFKLFPHRLWAFLAIPVALLAGEGIIIIAKSFKGKIRTGVVVLILISISGLYPLIGSDLQGSLLGDFNKLTSGTPKYFVETSMWPSGYHIRGPEEIQGFAWLKTLPPDTKVFLYTPYVDSFIIGFDKFSCSWCEEIFEFRKELIDKDLDEVHKFLKENDYEYTIISGMSFRHMAQEWGQNKSQEHIDRLLQDLQNSTKFMPAFQTQAAIVLKVV
ncbi:MAG: hypothetical protein KAJ70_04120 [Candidatus Omnitrophica bacterium]|nr:hypothetical protein [Candidatus Omnitrophota bacterium]